MNAVITPSPLDAVDDRLGQRQERPVPVVRAAIWDKDDFDERPILELTDERCKRDYRCPAAGCNGPCRTRSMTRRAWHIPADLSGWVW